MVVRIFQLNTLLKVKLLVKNLHVSTVTHLAKLKLIKSSI